MIFTDYLKKYPPATYSCTTVTDTFTGAYLATEFPKNYHLLKDKDTDAVNALKATAVTDIKAAATLPAKQQVLLRLIAEFENFTTNLGPKLEKRALKAEAEKIGRVAMANAATQVQLPERINGDRVLHFTTAFGPIVQSNKLRINRTSDQGCIFCVPARYAAVISDEPPSSVKAIFDIHGDLSHYVEFNLEGSANFESYNSRIDAKFVKQQRELKVDHEILDLSRRNAQWYEWKGKSQGGWAVVPGPYNWGQ